MTTRRLFTWEHSTRLSKFAYKLQAYFLKHVFNAWKHNSMSSTGYSIVRRMTMEYQRTLYGGAGCVAVASFVKGVGAFSIPYWERAGVNDAYALVLGQCSLNLFFSLATQISSRKSITIHMVLWDKKKVLKDHVIKKKNTMH